jgi:FkbM family methyltransferase
MNPAMIAAVLALGAVATAAAIFARRAWPASTSLERQLMYTRAQQAEQHREDLERAQITTERLEAQIGRTREETGSHLEDVTQSINQLGARIGGLTDRLSEISGVTREIAGRIGTIADAVEIVTRKPLYDFPIDSGRVETKTEEQVIALAESLTVLRPLVPYPKWRFDADWTNPDLAFLLRQRLWQYFNDRKREAPIVTRWHYETRLSLHLGNDLSRQIYIAGCIDPNEFAFLDRFLEAGMTFFDAGANEGVYTVFAAKRVGSQGSVWAFEPSQREVARLQRNLDINNLSAQVFPLALADRAGEAELAVAAYGHEGLNTLGTFVHEIEEGRKEMVQVARLDDVVNQNPTARLDMIKIDVEGAELRLLKGATATLGRYRPVLLFEVTDATLRRQGSSREELLDYLRAQGYVLYLFDPYSGLPAPANSAAYSDNMIAAPEGMSLPDAVYQPWPEIGNDAGRRS